MRSGYTFIEILIVVAVLGIVSVVAVNSYNIANERIEFHTEISKLQSMISNSRSQALSDVLSAESTGGAYIVEFRYGTDEEVRSYQSGSEGDAEVLDLSLGEDDIMDIYKIKYLSSGTWVTGSPSDVLKFQYLAPDAECTFLVNDIDDISTSMVQISFARTGEADPVRYLYFHKKSCLSELLIDDLTASE